MELKTVIETLLLGMIALVNGYTFKRIDNFESRLDGLKAEIIGIRYQLDWIVTRVDRVRKDDMQEE